MSVADKITRLTTARSNISTAITNKGGTVTSGDGFEDFASDIGTIPTRVEPEEKDINFYDYDGTLLYSWSLDELQSKTELPPNPTHQGLIAQGWDWTLATLKADGKPVQVGQNYITDDGKTRLYLYFESGLPLSTREVTLSIYQTVTNGVTIDWGDGSATETLSGTGSVYTTHTYQDDGNYTLTLLPDDSCFMGLGQHVGGNYNVIAPYDTQYGNFLKKAELGKNLHFNYSGNAFRGCKCLKTISIPVNNTGGWSHWFHGCSSLECIVFPNVNYTFNDTVAGECVVLKACSISESMQMLSNSFFGSSNVPKLSLHRITTFATAGNYLWNIQKLREIDLSSVTTIVKNIRYLSGLIKATFGANITSFDTGLLPDSPLLQEVHFKATTPVPITVSTAFQNAPTTCKFYVPTGSLSEYTSATNYPDSTVYTYVEE